MNKRKYLPFLLILFFAIFLFSYAKYSNGETASRATQTGSSYDKGFGGRILIKPSKNVTQAKSTCESGGTCSGTCSNTWTDISATSCGQGTFSLSPKYPKSVPSEYCTSTSARNFKSIISAGKIIIGKAGQSIPTQIGICTCISGVYCNQTTTETVSTNLAHITLFGTSK